MTKGKSTKRALLMSGLALLACISMLIGSTFAWFTDSVASANNVIKSGNLDVELYYSLDGETWNEVDEDTNVFGDSLWEPGHTEVVYLKVANAGSLALKYNLGVNIASETGSYSVVDGEYFELSDYIKFGITEGVLDSRDAAIAAVEKNATTLKTPYSDTDVLMPAGAEDNADEAVVTMVVYMPETVGNEANHAKGADVPTINLGINLFATQLAYESDSFGIDYDDMALAYDAESLNKALANGGYILLIDDIEIEDGTNFAFAAPVGKESVLNLNGNDITKVSTVSDRNNDGKYTSADNQGVFQVKGNLSVIGDGVVSMENTGANMEWNALSAVFSVEGGDLTLGEGVSAIHKGGTDMAFAVDVNTTLGKTALTVDGAILTSSYTAVRMFNFNAKNTAIVNVNSGIVSGAKRDIWKQADGPYELNIPDNCTTADGYIYNFEGTYVASAAALQVAVGVAADGEVITLIDDIDGDVIAAQKPDVKITIEGNDKVFAGVLTVDGKSKTYTTAGLTIKNVNFKADSISADACIQLGDGTNDTRYTCNVTVADCTFDVPGAVGVKSYTGGDKNLTITGCTATANAHSLVQAKGIDGILVEGCKVYSKNGLNFNNSDNVTVVGCTVDVRGYAVRFGESSGGVGAAETYEIKGCVLKSACDDGDAVIVLRGTADYATLTVTNTTIDGDIRVTNKAKDAKVFIDGTQVISNADSLIDALENGKNVVLSTDLKDVPVNNTAPYGNKYGVAVNGGVLDGNGKVLDFDCAGDNYGVMTSGGTIKNVSVGGVFRGIMIMNPTKDLYIDNVTINDEDVCYALNTGEGDGTHSLYVSNSTLCGWTSIGTAVKDVTFTNVTFGQGSYYTNVYGRLVKPYVNALFENCEFGNKFYIDLSQLGKDGDGHVLDPNAKITLKNCTVNGVKLTAANWTSLIAPEDSCADGQISIELKDGSYLTADNVVDYIIFE